MGNSAPAPHPPKNTESMVTKVGMGDDVDDLVHNFITMRSGVLLPAPPPASARA